MKGEKLFIVFRLSNCCAHLAFAHFIHIINHEILLCWFFPFDLFIKVNEHFFFFFFAFEWSQNRFLLVLRLLLRDFCLLNDHQSACVFLLWEERQRLLRVRLRGAMRELVINWCDSRTFYNDPKFLHLIDFDFQPKKRVFSVEPRTASSSTNQPFAWLNPHAVILHVVEVLLRNVNSDSFMRFSFNSVIRKGHKLWFR